MKTTFIIVIIVVLGLSGAAWGTTYYVSSSSGSDANSGTSSGTAWQTIAKVNGRTFQAGDSILFRRGDVWNESLVPPSSGVSGNPITFDAYGSGAPPNLTGYYAVPSSAWVHVTGNAWKAALPSVFSSVNFCLFGSVWGQKVAASTSNLTAQWDFYLANGYLYIFSQGAPSNYYNAPIVPMALSNVPVININGQSWLTIQHFLVNWFDDYGVYVQGASDHLIFANMEVDSMIPQGTQPLGFYINESAQPTDIKFYNDEAHLNYDGFRIDGFTFNGVGTPITLVNDKAYGNRDGALVDNTGQVDSTCTSSGCTDGGASMGPGAASYSYCHFYASSLAVANSTDVVWPQYALGPRAGAGNVAQDTPPAVQVWQRYPAQVTLTVDDAGMTQGADTYYANTVLPIADAAGVPVGAAITVGYPLAQTLIPEFQSWIDEGRDVTAHSMSHTYYTNTDALEVQYLGAGSAATLSISNKMLTITVTGAPDGVSYDLTQGQPQGTIQGLRQALLATGKFTATEIQTCQGPYGTGCSAYTESALLAQDLADVSSQDVKSNAYHMQLDVTRLTMDEITLSRQWMTKYLTGLPTTPVFVYPGGYETQTMQGIAAGVPFGGARGALKEDLGVKDTYASGFDVQNVTSFGVNPTWQGLQPAVLNQKVQALVWKQMVWGAPWGIFWHWNAATATGELSATEITNLIADLQNAGATIQSNTDLVDWLNNGTLETGPDGNFYYKLPTSTMALDFRPTGNAPVVDAGQNLGAAYQIDINGLNQNNYGNGWEIGAHVFVPYSSYGPNTGGPYVSIGGTRYPFVTNSFFGIHVNESISPWPNQYGFNFGGFRSLSSQVNWSDINTASGVYNWTKFDSWMAKAAAAGQDVLYTIYSTPAWASSNPTDICTGYAPDIGGCDPPNDLNSDGTGTNQHFKDYVTALMNHVGSGKIRYVEVWNEPNITTEWSGTYAQMIRMASDAYTIVKAADPNALVLSPPVSYDMALNNWMKPYLQAGGGQYADIIGVHGYLSTPGVVCPNNCPVPENVGKTLDDMRALMLANGQQNKSLFDTEGAWGITANVTDPDIQVAFTGRFYLIQVAGTAASRGFDRFYWYGWDIKSGEEFRDTASSTITPTGIAYQQLYNWTIGAMMSPCLANGTIWTCTIKRLGGYQALAVWDTAQACSGGVCTTSTYAYDPRYTKYYTLAGSASIPLSGGTVQIGAKVILLSQ